MSEFAPITHALASGRAVLLPTETVWGLAARASSARGVAEIYRLKGRIDAKPLAVCVRGDSDAEALASLCDTSRALMAAHWPGPLTLVLPLLGGADIDPHCTDAAAGTVALRCPDTPWRDALCARPLALTSANPSGAPSVTEQKSARALFPDTPLLPDPEPERASAPSTIVRVVDGSVAVLRQGSLRL